MFPAEQAPIRILMAEDDPDDRLLTQEAFEEARLVNALQTVEDGVELMEFLDSCGKVEGFELPDLILLDLNMPRKSGRAALQEIKADPRLRHIPVVVLTTSKATQDVHSSYMDGAASIITKPDTFEGLVDVIRAINTYWIQVVRLPTRRR